MPNFPNTKLSEARGNAEQLKPSTSEEIILTHRSAKNQATMHQPPTLTLQQPSARRRSPRIAFIYGLKRAQRERRERYRRLRERGMRSSDRSFPCSAWPRLETTRAETKTAGRTEGIGTGASTSEK
ncbi:hypothetical protein NHQ30_009026 [Ciborinia camelliae]|nr:hypothetical protein NHQ30_009026 [Ciborinia camelliae]